MSCVYGMWCVCVVCIVCVWCVWVCTVCVWGEEQRAGVTGVTGSEKTADPLTDPPRGAWQAGPPHPVEPGRHPLPPKHAYTHGGTAGHTGGRRPQGHLGGASAGEPERHVCDTMRDM